MSTEPFRRHTRRRVDAATRHVFASLADRPDHRHAFARLVWIAHGRSDLLRALPPARGCPALDALRNLARFHRGFTGDPAVWPGAVGHPLYVVDVLARHLLGRYPTPRVLARVWFGGDTPRERRRRRWYIAHSRGQRFRTLPLPLVMTRRMEHVFLRTPDHVDLDHALRRAEVIGLGGSPSLADAVCATRLGQVFDRGAFWRTVIEWFVRHEDELDLAEVRPIVDYVQGARHVRAAGRGPDEPDLSLTGRTVAAVGQARAAWQRARLPRWPARPAARLAWSRSRWDELVHAADDERWRMVELVDSDQLRHEGQVMRHCVAIYAARCARGDSSIWSLRRRGGDAPDEDRSVLTIEVQPRMRMIVQIRGVANARGVTGLPAELVWLWAARERLVFADNVRVELGR